MSAWEREHGELPDPNLLLFSRKTGQGLFVFKIGFDTGLVLPKYNPDRPA
jgi:hypothetical protein